MGKWLRSNVDGVITATEDVPSNRHPRYATRYTISDPQGNEQIVWGTWADGTLPRSLPVGTHIRKKRWHLDYEQDGRTVRFAYGFYGISLSIALGVLIWGILSAHRLLKSVNVFRPQS